MRIFLAIFLTFSVLLMPCAIDTAAAQGDMRLQNSLNYLNKSKPLQNPRLSQIKDVLGNNILDRRNRVVGEVNDILLTGNGEISALNTDLDRLHVRSDVFLNFSQMRIRTVSDAYTLNISDDQLEEMLPSLLNNIETAAGRADVFSLRKIQGAPLLAEDGSRLGEIQDVLFSNGGARAQALYVELNNKSVRREKLAIPFSATRVVSTARGVEVLLSNAQADAVLEYARNR